MKLLVVGDLHGHIPKIHFKEFDAIICVGDYCSSEKIWKHTKIQYKKFLKNPYNRKAWYDDIGRVKAKKLIKESLNAGRKVLVKLNLLNVPIYTIPGNWDFVHDDEDWAYLNKDYYKTFLIKGLKNVKDCHQKIIKIRDNKGNTICNIIGYGIVNGPELLKYRNYQNIKKKSYVKNEQRYKKLLSKYNKLFMKSKKSEKSSQQTIFLSHNVPYNTLLDKIVNKDSPMNGHHYGSNLARDMIVKHKPLMCIGGHMHEHYGTCKIGKTVILNAGFGGEKNTLIELEDGKIKSIKFYGKKK